MQMDGNVWPKKTLVKYVFFKNLRFAKKKKLKAMSSKTDSYGRCCSLAVVCLLIPFKRASFIPFFLIIYIKRIFGGL